MDANVDTGRWLHASLAEVAGSLVGLDVDSAGVDWAVATGYEAYVVDVQDEAALAALRLAPADVVVAGEIIEHVESPGLFLRSVRPLLAESGRLVVTTPNAYRLPGFLALTLGEELIHPDHVGIHSVHTLRELGRRCGYRVERLGYYQNQAVLPRSGVGLAISGLRRLQSAALRRWPYWSDGVYAIYSRNLLDL
jgi:SAM-dependent methyltransferase